MRITIAFHPSHTMTYHMPKHYEGHHNNPQQLNRLIAPFTPPIANLLIRSVIHIITTDSGHINIRNVVSS